MTSLRSEVQSRNKVLEQVKEREKKAEEESERVRRGGMRRLDVRRENAGCESTVVLPTPPV